MNPRLRTLLNVLAALAIIAGFASSCAAVMHAQRIGGSVTNGVFHPNHGIPPAQQPSQADLNYSGWLADLMCLTVPLMVVAFFYVFKIELYPLFYSRGSYDQAVAAVREIQGSGAPICRTRADFILGGTPVGGTGSLLVEVYSGGIVLSAPLYSRGAAGFGPFGVSTEEIRSASIAQRYGKSGLLIWHNGLLGNPLFIYNASQELIDAVLSIAPKREALPARH